MQIGSASTAIHDAYAIGFIGKGQDMEKMLSMDFKSSRGFRDMNWHHVDKCEAGLIIAELSRLPVHLQAWAIWCHGPRLPEYMPEQGRFFTWLNDDVGIKLLEQELEREKKFSVGQLEKIRTVVACTAMDYQHFAITGQHEFPVSKIQKFSGIQRQNWKRDFQQWHSYAWNLCDELDREVLPLVGGVLGRIKNGLSNSA